MQKIVVTMTLTHKLGAHLGNYRLMFDRNEDYVTFLDTNENCMNHDRTLVFAEHTSDDEKSIVRIPGELLKECIAQFQQGSGERK